MYIQLMGEMITKGTHANLFKLINDVINKWSLNGEGTENWEINYGGNKQIWWGRKTEFFLTVHVEENENDDDKPHYRAVHGIKNM